LRAQKPKGSVVYNRSRATWNYLFMEGGKRKSRKLGTLSDLPTKADAIRKAEVVKRERGWSPDDRYQQSPSWSRATKPNACLSDTVRAAAMRVGWTTTFSRVGVQVRLWI
jgi:hypothetical protein